MVLGREDGAGQLRAEHNRGITQPPLIANPPSQPLIIPSHVANALLLTRYKGRIIYNTRYQDSCGSSSNLSTGSTPGSLVGASAGVAGGASSTGGRETRRSSRFRAQRLPRS